MEYTYKSLTVYADSTGNLIIFPTTVAEMRGVTGGAIVGIDLPHQLKPPFDNSVMENEIQKAFDECYSKEADLSSTPIERFLKIKGYGKAVEGKKLVSVRWTEDTGYVVIPTRKEHKPKRGYIHLNEQSINLGKQFAPGEMAKAVRTAIEISTS
jgi:hypothetical protein